MHDRQPSPIRPDRETYLDELRTGRHTWAFVHVNKCGGTSVEAALGIPKIHDTAIERIAAIGRERWDALFTFALVRHPYDRAASQYRYRVRKNYTGLGDRHLTVSEWIVEAIGNRNPEYYDQPLMFAACTDWLVDEAGALLVDRVERLEDITSTWSELMSAVGSSAPLEHRNRTRHDGAQIDAVARSVLDEHCAADFERFGYAPY